MNRREALLVLGSGAIGSLAGCASEEQSETAATPPLKGIILWSLLETDSEPVEVQITVEKDGSQVFETVHEFQGESRVEITEEWPGDAAPYSVTIAPTVHDDPTTYSSADLSQPDSIDCWGLLGMFDSSTIDVGSLLEWYDC